MKRNKQDNFPVFKVFSHRVQAYYQYSCKQYVVITLTINDAICNLFLHHQRYALQKMERIKWMLLILKKKLPALNNNISDTVIKNKQNGTIQVAEV